MPSNRRQLKEICVFFSLSEILWGERGAQLRNLRKSLLIHRVMSLYKAYWGDRPDEVRETVYFKDTPKKKRVKKTARKSFKKDVPKHLRKEWGDKMNFLRSL